MYAPQQQNKKKNTFQHIRSRRKALLDISAHIPASHKTPCIKLIWFKSYMLIFFRRRSKVEALLQAIAKGREKLEGTTQSRWTQVLDPGATQLNCKFLHLSWFVSLELTLDLWHVQCFLPAGGCIHGRDSLKKKRAEPPKFWSMSVWT